MAFECSQCGACCRHVDTLDGFPEPFDATGRCAHLGDDNACRIYDTRPLICRVDESFSSVESIFGTREAWYAANARACEELREYEKRDGKVHLAVVD
jgi:uncharacterized protein